jgi:hypothetical protein
MRPRSEHGLFLLDEIQQTRESSSAKSVTPKSDRLSLKIQFCLYIYWIFWPRNRWNKLDTEKKEM